MGYRSEAGTPCKVIQLEIPGVEKSSIKVHVKSDQSLGGTYSVEVSGRKEKMTAIDYLKKSRIAQNNHDLAPNSENPDYSHDDDELLVADGFRYGDFAETFQIPIDFETNCKMIWPSNGVLLLVFPARKVEVELSLTDEGD